MKRIVLLAALFAGTTAFAPTAAAAEGLEPARPSFAKTKELLIHGFRNPSIGLELRYGWLGVHAGAYTTIVGHAKDAEATSSASWFFKTGLTAYALPVRLTSDRPSNVFVSASYLRGTNNGWTDAVAFEGGFRWAVVHGLDLRLGAAVLLAPGERVRVNPTPGISWSVPL